MERPDSQIKIANGTLGDSPSVCTDKMSIIHHNIPNPKPDDDTGDAKPDGTSMISPPLNNSLAPKFKPESPNNKELIKSNSLTSDYGINQSEMKEGETYLASFQVAIDSKMEASLDSASDIQGLIGLMHLGSRMPNRPHKERNVKAIHPKPLQLVLGQEVERQRHREKIEKVRRAKERRDSVVSYFTRLAHEVKRVSRTKSMVGRAYGSMDSKEGIDKPRVHHPL
jgi:hypothetical protein